MAHSCKDRATCCLKYTSFLFLFTAALATAYRRHSVAISLGTIFTTSFCKYWLPASRLYDVTDAVVVNAITAYNVFYVQPYHIVATAAVIYNLLIFLTLSRNNCAAHSTIHVATVVGCLPWILGS